MQEGTGGVALKLQLPVQEFQVYPQQQVKIPVQVYNPSYLPASAVLRLAGVDPAWLIEEKQVLHLPPGERVETVFLGQIPATIQVTSQLYSFTVEARLANCLSSRVEGSLFILPQGSVEFRCFPKQQRIPVSRRFFSVPLP